MTDARWKPHVTVATIVEKDGKFLLVHEAPEGSAVYNQPAGHLDEGESLSEAAKRETPGRNGLGSHNYPLPRPLPFYCPKRGDLFASRLRRKSHHRAP